jgi:hypothetical protein
VTFHFHGSSTTTKSCRFLMMVKSIFRSRQHYDRDDRWRYSRYRDGRYDSRYDRDRDRRYSRYDWDRDRDWSYDRDRYSANPSRNHYND